MASRSTRRKLLAALTMGVLGAGASTTYLLYGDQQGSGLDLTPPEAPVAFEPGNDAEEPVAKQSFAQETPKPPPPPAAQETAATTAVLPEAAAQPTGSRAEESAAGLSVVRGTVLKNGVPGQRMEVLLSSGGGQGSGGDLRSRLRAVAGRDVGEPSSLRSGLDGQGRFQIEKVPPGRYQLEVRRQGEAGGRERAGGGRLHRQEISVLQGQTLTYPISIAVGELVGMTLAAEDNQPVAGARVFLVPGQEAREGGGQRGRGAVNAINALTDGKAFRFEDVPAGSYTLVAQAQGRRRFTQNVTIGMGAPARVDPRLEKANANAGAEQGGGNGPNRGRGAGPGRGQSGGPGGGGRGGPGGGSPQGQGGNPSGGGGNGGRR